MALPQHGLTEEEVLGRLVELQRGDKDFRRGRTFGLTYHAGEDHERVVARAHDLYVWHNALNPDVFPSLRTMQRDVLAIASEVLSGGVVGAPAQPELAGFLTSGGTESILCAVLAAIVRGREEKGVERPNVVLPTSAHAAFSKACSQFGAESRRVDVLADWRADVDAMADACDDDTVLVVGSAPQYPQGVIDPIPAIAALAVDRGTSCHVDACMGGWVLPFLEAAGLVEAPWDFRVPGVTTISADLHKYGYAPKGVSVVLHRDKASRRRQTFVFDGWLGGFYASSGLLGTKPGGPMAAAWASLHLLGREGLVANATASYRARQRLEDGVRAVEGLTVLGQPEVTLAAIAADPTSAVAVDVFKVMDVLFERGWHLDRQGPPESLHATCVPAHDGEPVESFLADLADVVAEVGEERTEDRSTRYAVLE